MGFFDSAFGGTSAIPPSTGDAQAIARYRYLLRTAPPDAIEQAHAEAFAQLTPHQRAVVLRQLAEHLPSAEVGVGTDPRALARTATRAELRRPGILEHALGGAPGFGGLFATSLLSSIAGTFIGSAIAHHFLDGFHGSPEAAGVGEHSPAMADASDMDEGGDDGGWDDGGGDLDGDLDGGDFGDV